MPSLSTVRDRSKLKVRRDPHWSKIIKGCYLGFRKMAAGSSGTWMARYRDEATGRQQHKPLGEFSELPDHQRYDAAKAQAEEWFAHMGKGGTNDAITVADACNRYVEQLRRERREKAAEDALGRFKRHVLSNSKFACLELSKLTPAHLERWRNTLRDTPSASGSTRGQARSDSAMNRDMTALRAALNQAFKIGAVTSTFAWRSQLVPLKNADRRRDQYLDLDQRRQLVTHAAGDLADFLRCLSVLPLRPGALARLTVANFDRRLNTLTIGQDKTGDRTIPLPDETAALLRRLSASKLPTAPLITRPDGQAWNKDSWKYPLKAAVAAAGLPNGVTAYTIRHSVITDLIVHAGLDTLTVARLSGTSIQMIERHYGHLAMSKAKTALSRLALP